jgi:hypothetical protein
MKTSKLWLRNTSRYPDAEVWPLIKCAYESVERSVAVGQKMPPIIVKFTNNSRSYRGRAHWVETEYKDKKNMWAGSVRWLRILVRIGKPDKFPVQVRYPRFKGDMPEYECRTYREAAVMVAAHEMEHCLGACGRKGGEFRCEMSAWDAIDYYRKHQAEVDGEINAALATRSKRESETQQRRASMKTPEIVVARKLEAARAMLAKWQRKQKLATTKAKQYQRSVRRLEKKLSELITPAPLALAAKTEQ